MPHVSVATAATLRSQRNSDALMARPGAGPPEYSSPQRAALPHQAEPAGAHQHDVALADLDALLLGRRLQLVLADGLAHVEPALALEVGDVEQHAAADHLVLDLR